MKQNTLITSIASDTLTGLLSKPKFLKSKYFYDDVGSTIFQDIMNMPEYYLTRCEEEIFTVQKETIASALCFEGNAFRLIELGSGDGQKTRILLHQLAHMKVPFQYIPLDISKKANEELKESISQELPQVEVNPFTGDYFTHLQFLNGNQSIPTAILFLGSNIGNFSWNETSRFLKKLADFTAKGDKVLIGFDMKKAPDVIIKAYNDSHGHTCKFNLNLLTRLNRELEADFITNMFEHHITYNPETGELKSYLVSKANQQVYLGALGQTVSFEKWEPVFMELSRKYDEASITQLAGESGFTVKANYTDSRNYFVDSLWEKV